MEGSRRSESAGVRGLSMKHFAFAAGLLALAGGLEGQTQVDLRVQSKDINFSNATATLPMQVGTVLPAVCATGQMFFKSNAASGSNLFGCVATNTWALEASGSGGGGGGTTSASGLTDLAATRTSATTLTIGPQCSPAAPCNVRFGNQTFAVQAPGVVNISAGTGLAFIYIASSGALTVGHNVTASCSSGCAAQAGVAAFPADAVPLFTWSATSGAWDAGGGIDLRAFLSSKNVTPGTGLLSVSGSGATTLSIDTTVTGQRTTVPATSTSACSVGTWAADTSFYYVCVSTNGWKRAALSSF